MERGSGGERKEIIGGRVGKREKSEERYSKESRGGKVWECKGKKREGCMRVRGKERGRWKWLGRVSGGKVLERGEKGGRE